AVVVLDGRVLARAGNRNRTLKDPTAHAEVLAIREACAHLQSDRIPKCDLYVTLEPCTQCAGSIALARLRRVYFGAEDKKGGAVVNGVRFFNQPTCQHVPEVYGGLAEKESAKLLEDFFQALR
ncbi:MAG: nucleoside deaminase, partial [Pseudomonadota bacterium]